MSQTDVLVSNDMLQLWRKRAAALVELTRLMMDYSDADIAAMEIVESVEDSNAEMTFLIERSRRNEQSSENSRT